MTRLTAICVGSILVGLILAGQSYAAIDPDTILGAWLVYEGAGDVTVDASGNGHDGRVMGSPTWVAGVFGNALDFSGSSSYVDCGAPEAFNVDVFSVSLWCNITTIQGWTHLISRGSHVAAGSPGSVNWAVMMRDGQEAIVWETFNNTGWAAAKVFTTIGEWHHVVVTLDGTAAQLYHDGVLGATFSGGTFLDESRAFMIGAKSDPGSAYPGYFDGSIDEVGYFNTILTPDDIETIMNSGLAEIVAGSPVAVNPQPAIGQTDVLRDPVLGWMPGEFAATHNVYFSDNFDDVSNGAPSALIADGIVATNVAPGRLAFETTYYWRVDEVTSAPDFAVLEGTVWSFTVEPFAYPIQNVVATSTVASDAGTGPENTVNGSGLNANDGHSIAATDMWLTATGAELPSIQFEFDRVYKLHEMLVWNCNVRFELGIGLGVKDATVEYSPDGTNWMVLGDVALAQGTAQADYAANTTIAFDGIAAKYVRLNVNSGYGFMGQYGLSEVRFRYILVNARESQPADGATDVSVDGALGWRSGLEAVSHEVYLGTDPEDLTLVDTVASPGYTPDDLQLATTYYWQVTEVNDAATPSTWEGSVWSFVTQEFVVVDDFESYDDEDNVIYEAWIDGWVNGTGSTVGYFEAPFAEQDIVHGGRQSMPLFYDNAGGVSEADLTLAGQDWTRAGITTLTLYFRGDAGNTGGQLYVKINGVKVAYNGGADALSKLLWRQWNIDLALVGTDLRNVTTLTVGIEGSGSGQVYVDDIRLYLEAPAVATPIYPGTDGVLLQYTFDGDANDSSGNGYHGTLIGDARVQGGVLALDGIRDLMSVPRIGGANATFSEFTVSMWVYPTADLAALEFSGGMNTNGWSAGAVHLKFHYGLLNVGINGLTGSDLEGTAVGVTNAWNHIALTVSETEIAIYLNGNREDSAVLDTPAAAVLGGASLGAWNNADVISREMTGEMDNVRIYDRALSEGEILFLAGV